jgi:hypothetical protein
VAEGQGRVWTRERGEAALAAILAPLADCELCAGAGSAGGAGFFASAVDGAYADYYCYAYADALGSGS